MNRRDLLKLLLATAAAEAVDFEQLLWVPKPIVTVPGFRTGYYYYRYEFITIDGQILSCDTVATLADRTLKCYGNKIELVGFYD